MLVCRLVHFIFDNYGCTVANGDRVAVVAPSVKGLYHLQMVERVNAVTSGCHTKGCIHEWHRKLGHRDVQAILELERKGFATGMLTTVNGLLTVLVKSACKERWHGGHFLRR